jgi:hypothetical protein
MQNKNGALYPETTDEIATVFQSRQNRESHPGGTFDSGGRWFPNSTERASCCALIRRPSRAHPYWFMLHCRTLLHITTCYQEHLEKQEEGAASMHAG